MVFEQVSTPDPTSGLHPFFLVLVYGQWAWKGYEGRTLGLKAGLAARNGWTSVCSPTPDLKTSPGQT